MSYLELLQRDEWKAFRSDFIEYRRKEGHESQCDECGDITRGTLRVHHKAYRTGLLPWEYEFDELRLLCKECHGRIHFTESKWRDFIRSLPPHVCYELDDFLEQIQRSNPERLKVIFARCKNVAGEIAPS